VLVYKSKWAILPVKSSIFLSLAMNTMLVDSSPDGVRSSTGFITGWAEVWIDRLDLPAIEVESLTRFLTAAELALCDRCRLPHVRQHKIVARARLRQILSGL
jgi:hypothetical protein